MARVSDGQFNEILQNQNWNRLKFNIQTRQIGKNQSAREANFPNPICANKSFYHTSRLINVRLEQWGESKCFPFFTYKIRRGSKFKM
jgi:hypothetical protein